MTIDELIQKLHRPNYVYMMAYHKTTPPGTHKSCIEARKEIDALVREYVGVPTPNEPTQTYDDGTYDGT